MEILITGLGAILPWGDFTLNGESQRREGEGALTHFQLSEYLSSPKTYLDRCSALSLAGCALALKDAGLAGPLDEDFGLNLGTLYGCVETMRSFESKLAEAGVKTVSPLLFSHSYFNSPASICAIEWGLKGHHTTYCGPHAGEDAVEGAIDALRLGHATRMVCGGADALSKSRALADETGVAGEGAVFLVLGTAEAYGARESREKARAFAWKDAPSRRAFNLGAVTSLAEKLGL